MLIKWFERLSTIRKWSKQISAMHLYQRLNSADIDAIQELIIIIIISSSSKFISS